MQKRIELPAKFHSIFTTPARYRVWYGGRGSSKSHSIARALLIIGMQKTTRILCCREFQASIADSSHRLLSDLIREYELDDFYDITKTEIRGQNGTLFIFRGIKVDPHGIKSLEGVDIAWVEESEKISNESLDMLIPTIRKPGSEVWFSFNPFREQDPIYQRFIINRPPDALVEKVNWQDNPWFPEVLKYEMEYDRSRDFDRYSWIWEGNPLGISEAQIFKDRFVVEEFDTPADAEFYHGADWGFAQDPTAATRCFIRGNRLYIDMEASGIGVDIDDTPALLDRIPTFRKWVSYADSARPETISYMNRHGFPNMRAVKKWAGSVEDGIEYLKSFEKIVIHPRCKGTIEEFSLYQYKVDKQTGDILPVVVDANNHHIDSLRYALSKYITAKQPKIASPTTRRAFGYS